MCAIEFKGIIILGFVCLRYLQTSSEPAVISVLLFHGHGRPYIINMDPPSTIGEQQRLQKLLAQNRRALRAEQQRLRRGIAQKCKQGQQTTHAVYNLTASVDLATSLAQRLTSCHDSDSLRYPTAATMRDFLPNSDPVAMAPNARAMVAAKRYYAESTITVKTKILNYRHGVTPYYIGVRNHF